jgi:DNA-binding FrmR family transcriptional regulator
MNSYTLTASKQQMIDYLRTIEGQVRGLQEMLCKDSYCMDVVQQTTAIKQALSRIEDILMENHLSACSVREIKDGNANLAVEEILRVYQLKRK